MSKLQEKKRKYFGTDGIRGRANVHPMTADFIQRLGRAAGTVLRRGEHRHTVVIGKDTRLSGYMFESALQAGFTAVGIHTVLIGPVPTPGVAFITRALRADLGVMISASHNPHHDNGIKFFGPDGRKLADETELEIERILDDPTALDDNIPDAEQLGRAYRVDDAQGRYIEFCKNSFSRNMRLEGLRVVVDCAHGAAYKVAPKVFWELGADVIPIGDKPNGLNINNRYGCLHPERIQERVKEVRADIGIALDGDADRLIVCDENSHILDGDHILALCAMELKRNNRLTGGGIVTTVMSNLGLERYLNQNDLHLVRTKVGDRYVLQHMREHGYNLGGEQSGHLIFADHNTTGDGIISALKLLEAMANRQRSLSELGQESMQALPQVLKNVTIRRGDDPMVHPQVKEAMAEATQALGDSGRILVRPSGTEPKIRVMIEGDSINQINNMADEICEAIRTAST